MASRWDDILTDLDTRIQAVSSIGTTYTGRRWPESPANPSALLTTGTRVTLDEGPGWRRTGYPIEIRVRGAMGAADKPAGATAKATIEGIVEDILDDLQPEEVASYSTISNLVSISSLLISQDEPIGEYEGELVALIVATFEILET